MAAAGAEPPAPGLVPGLQPARACLWAVCAHACARGQCVRGACGVCVRTWKWRAGPVCACGRHPCASPGACVCVDMTCTRAQGVAGGVRTRIHTGSVHPAPMVPRGTAPSTHPPAAPWVPVATALPPTLAHPPGPPAAALAVPVAGAGGGQGPVPRCRAGCQCPSVPPGATKARFCSGPLAPWLLASVTAASGAGGPRTL